MSARAPFKRLILRAVLRNVSPMVIRVIAVSDSLSLHELDEVFRTVLGWENIGFIFHMQGLEFSSFRRATRSRTLREFQLRPGETFLYTCGGIDLWEWEMRVLGQETGSEGDDAPLCLGGSRAPTRSVPFPGRCTVVRRPREGRPLPRGTSCAAPPQAVLTLRQALVGFFQAEALRLQGAVFLQPAVDAFQTLVERFAQRLPSVGLRLRVGGRQHSEEGLHLNGCAHCFSLLLAF